MVNEQIVNEFMAKVEWADAIKTVSGALTKINKKSPHAADQKMILGTHRTAATSNPNCSRLYIRGLSAVSRSTLPTANELLMRQRFAAVRAAVAARKEDMSKVDADQAAFIAQRDTAGGKKTMNAYLWSLECATYDEAHPRN